MLSVPCCTDTRHAATLVEPLCDETLVRLPFDSEPVPVQSWNLFQNLVDQYSDHGQIRNPADQNTWGTLIVVGSPLYFSPFWRGLA